MFFWSSALNREGPVYLRKDMTANHNSTISSGEEEIPRGDIVRPETDILSCHRAHWNRFNIFRLLEKRNETPAQRNHDLSLSPAEHATRK